MNIKAWSGWDWAKLVLCIAIDLFDFTIGRALIVIPFEEIIYTGLTTLMWGWKGLLTLFEIVELTEQIDAFIPLSTATALWALKAKHG